MYCILQFSPSIKVICFPWSFVNDQLSFMGQSCLETFKHYWALITLGTFQSPLCWAHLSFSICMTHKMYLVFKLNFFFLINSVLLRSMKRTLSYTPMEKLPEGRCPNVWCCPPSLGHLAEHCWWVGKELNVKKRTKVVEALTQKEKPAGKNRSEIRARVKEERRKGRKCERRGNKHRERHRQGNTVLFPLSLPFNCRFHWLFSST